MQILGGVNADEPEDYCNSKMKLSIIYLSYIYMKKKIKHGV